MSNLDQFIERHEPKSFSELVFAEPDTQKKLAHYSSRRLFGNILLYGTFGSAKSSIGQIIIKERQRLIGIQPEKVFRFGGKKMKAGFEIEMQNIFSMLLNSSFYGDNEPYILIDEVDRLTKSLQWDLIDFIDTFPAGKFIMTTNNFNDVDRAIRSRSDRLEILLASPQQWVDRAEQIIKAEGYSVPKKEILQLLEEASLDFDETCLRDYLRAINEAIVDIQSSQGIVHSSMSVQTTRRKKEGDTTLAAQTPAPKKKRK